MDTIITILARELGREPAHVENVVKLIDEGNTIPFIARYRKELHGAMDDTTLRTLADRLQYLRNLDKRREEVKASIEGQGKLTEELAAAIDAAATLAEVEDLYLPYKPKRRTRATMAKEKGLEPLADALFAKGSPVDPAALAADFIDPEKGVETVEDALQGASDIIAEAVSDDAAVRKALRELYLRRGSLVSWAAEEEPADTVYRLYYDFTAPVNRVQGHQVLAINRGEREGILKAGVELDAEAARVAVRRQVVPGRAAMDFVRAAADDAWDRLLKPSLEREIRNTLTEQADEGAIHNFALNLKPLLMQPPVKGFVTMGLDPGYRNGCKVAVVDATGKVLDTAVVYPTFSKARQEEAIAVLRDQTERLSKVVRTLLDMSELQSVPRTDRIDIGPMVEEVLTDLIPLAEKKKITLAQEGGNVRMTGSDIRIYRVLYNLVENGIKYNKRGGSVTVSYRKEENMAVIHVSDTGQGIPEKCQSNIFQPFYRIDKSRSREYGGVGLGLSFAWESVRLHGGSISVLQSTPEGSTIEVELPV